MKILLCSVYGKHEMLRSDDPFANQPFDGVRPAFFLHNA